MKVALCKIDEIPDDGSKTVDFFGREVLGFNSIRFPELKISIIDAQSLGI